MKGIQGLIVAAGLGLLGAALNWLYLSEQGRRFKEVQFIAVNKEAKIHLGEVIREDHLGIMAVPEANAEKLENVVYLWKDRKTVTGIKATREYNGGEPLLRTDYRTPRPELNLKPYERLMWVTVDSRGFVPELVDPGDEVTFLVPPSVTPTPAIGSSVLPDGEGPEPVKITPAASGGVEMIGPFRVGSLGNRLGSIEVMRAGNITPTQDRQIGIIVKVTDNKLEPNAIKLQDRLQRVNHSNVGVILHPRAAKK